MLHVIIISLNYHKILCIVFNLFYWLKCYVLHIHHIEIYLSSSILIFLVSILFHNVVYIYLESLIFQIFSVLCFTSYEKWSHGERGTGHRFRYMLVLLNLLLKVLLYTNSYFPEYCIQSLTRICKMIFPALDSFKAIHPHLVTHLIDSLAVKFESIVFSFFSLSFVLLLLLLLLFFWDGTILIFCMAWRK